MSANSEFSLEFSLGDILRAAAQPGGAATAAMGVAQTMQQNLFGPAVTKKVSESGVVHPTDSGCSPDFDEYMRRAFEDDADSAVNIWRGRRIRVLPVEGGDWLEGSVSSLYLRFDDTLIGEEKITSTGARSILTSWHMDVVFDSDWSESPALSGMSASPDTGCCCGFELVRASINAGGTCKPAAGSSGMLMSFQWLAAARPNIRLFGDIPCPLCRAVPSESVHEHDSAECPCCLETKDCAKLPCGHAVCKQCWEQWSSKSDGSEVVSKFLAALPPTEGSFGSNRMLAL